MMTWWRRVSAAMLGAMILTSIPVSVQAVPPSPEVLERLRADGTLEDYKKLDASARRRGVNQPDPYLLAAEGTAAVTGNLGALVIIVEFTDNLAAGGGSYLDSSYFNDMLFSSNTPGYSMNDHYQEMSYGMVTISGQTVGWLTMPETYAYYVDGQRGFGSYPRNAQRLAEHAVDAAEAAGVDFSQYDNDSDGNIDGLFIVHAGRGYENTGDLNMIHSHQWVLGSARNYDGVTIWEYTMEPEENGSGQPIEVGVFSHEFGHFIGLPDLYDTDYSSGGMGLWCLMASGSYAGGSDYPAHMNVWCKMKLGWVNPTNITINTLAAEIPQIESEPVAYRIWAGGASGNEYFLVENRQRVGFDAYLRGPGICIYHIDDNKYGNTQEWYPGLPGSQHYLVAMEQADGAFDLERDRNGGDSSDPWPGATGKRAFDDFSSPNSKAYNGTPTQIAVWNISDSDSLMTANLDIWFSQPHFDLVHTTFTDDGNADGIPDPGENVSLVMAQLNGGSAVLDAEFMVTSDDPTLTFTDSTAYVGPVSTGATGSNVSDPFTFSVPLDYQPRIADFYLTVTAEGGSYQKTDTVSIGIGPDQVLVVDDDGQIQPYASYDVTYYNPVLDSLRVPYATWDVKANGTPTTLNNYPVVIWFTGDRRTDPIAGPDTTLTPSERTAIAAYLDQGGSLFLTGQQIAYMLDAADSAFMNDYLHAAYGGPATDFIAEGIPGDVVGDQTKYVLGGGGSAGNQLVKDKLVAVNGAVPAFEEDNNPGQITGVRYDGDYKVLFLGWGVEGIGDDIAYQFDAQTKAVLIERALDWMLYNAVFSGVTLQPLLVNPGQDATRLMDTAIDLYWNFVHPQGEPQDSVEVQVGSDDDWSTAEYWSYGPVAGGDTTVHYAGPTAQSGNTYHWRVRVFAGGTVIGVAALGCEAGIVHRRCRRLPPVHDSSTPLCSSRRRSPLALPPSPAARLADGQNSRLQVDRRVHGRASRPGFTSSGCSVTPLNTAL